MHIQDTLLLIPEGASGADWDECIRSAREELPDLKEHRGTSAPLAHRYIQLNLPVMFAPGSLHGLLKTLDQGAACAVPLSNCGHKEENIAEYFSDASLADHPNNRFAIAEHLTRTQAGRTRITADSARICCVSRTPTLFTRPACTVVLDSYVHVPTLTPAIHPEPARSGIHFQEDSMSASGTHKRPALCIWLHPDHPEPALTLTNMKHLAGDDIVLLNAASTLPADLPAGLDVWNVSPMSSWKSLAPKLGRWFGDRNVLLLRAGLFALPQQWQQLAEVPAGTGPVENTGSGKQSVLSNPENWNPEAPLNDLPWGWLVVNPVQPVPSSLILHSNLFILDSSPSQTPSVSATGGGLLPEAVKPHLMGFERMVVSGKGQTVDLSGNPCPQEGCDSILWKLEPTDLPGLALHLRRLREAGCRRMVLTFENAFFQTPHAPFAHPGCSPVAVRREVLQAGFRIGNFQTWEGCQSATYQENYFNTSTSSYGWSDEEKIMATHSRLWFVADACSEELHTERKVSVVILAINKVEYTRKCIESLRANCQQNIELILVNNGSSDSTRSYFDSIPGAKVIHNETNRGVAAGWNQGMRLATGDYILILNNDTIIAPGTVENLVRCAVNHPYAGIVVPRSNKIAGPQLVDGFTFTDESDIPRNALQIQRQNTLASWEFVPVKGFCMLIPSNVACQVGDFDERFGIGNFEDDDYSNRVFYHGYRLLVADDSFLFHFGSVSFNQANINWQAQMEKNQEIFNAKWEKGRAALQKSYVDNAQQDATRFSDEQQLRRALQEDELNPELYYQLGLVLYHKGQIKEAFSNYCKSLECDPTNEQVADETMRLLRKHFTVEENRDVIQYLQKRFPFSQALQGESPASPAEDASIQTLNERGIELFQQKLYPQAQEQFLRALNIQAEADTLLNFYDCSLHLGDLNTAKIYLEKGLQMFPDHEELRSAWQELMGLRNHPTLPGERVIYYRECTIAAEKFLLEGSPEQTRQALELTLSELPAHYRACNVLGLLYMYNKNYADAIQAFTQAVNSNPYYVDAVVNLFDSTALSGNTQLVQEPLQKVLALQPANQELLELRNHLERGTLPERLQLDPLRNGSILQDQIARGNTLLENGDFNQATILFTDILAEYPDNVQALNGVGIAAYQRGTYDDARLLFAHALKINPLDQDTLLNYWEACKKTGHRSAALSLLQNAIRKNPSLTAVSDIIRNEA